jgi:hypothetical protein
MRNLCYEVRSFVGSEKFMQEVRSFHPEESTCPPRASVLGGLFITPNKTSLAKISALVKLIELST